MITSQGVGRQYEVGFRICLFALVLVFAGLLCVFVPTLMVLAVLAGATALWMVFDRPITVLGVVLAIMPFHFLPIMLGQFFGFPNMTLLSGATKEIPLLLLLYVLWRRSGFKVSKPDWFLLGSVSLAVLRTALSGNVAGLWLDFEFILAYCLGRVTILSATQETKWAKYAIWISAAVSVLGLCEVFLIGDAPRKVLYLAVTGSPDLPDSFRATGFSGLRAASTMIGPPSLGALCMVALVLWWVYMRNPLPAALVGAGLVGALTRSTWIGAAAALTVLAFRHHQTRRLVVLVSVAVVAFVASVPFLGIRQYLSYTGAGQDESEHVHQDSELRGIRYALEHPFGSGPGTVGPLALAKDSNAVVTENTYLAFAGEYGILASLCFVGFLLSAMRMFLKARSLLAHAALGILIAFGTMMIVFLAHDDFRLGCWVWFPVGLAIRSCVQRRSPQVSDTGNDFAEELA